MIIRTIYFITTYEFNFWKILGGFKQIVMLYLLSSMLTSYSQLIIDEHSLANKDCRLVEKEIVYQGQWYVLVFFCLKRWKEECVAMDKSCACTHFYDHSTVRTLQYNMCLSEVIWNSL